MWILIVLGSVVFNYFYFILLIRPPRRSSKVVDHNENESNKKECNPIDYESSMENLNRPSTTAA